MLAEKVKQDIQELTDILIKLDNAERTILLSNALVLLARQEVSKHKEKVNLLMTELTENNIYT